MVFNLFKRYMSVGILNTLLHWIIFSIAVYLLEISQAVSNLIAFLIAVSFSYVLNATYTFKKTLRVYSYFIFIFFMGALSFLTGTVADKLIWSPWVTLVIFSSLSLVLGFLYSKFVVFKH